MRICNWSSYVCSSVRERHVIGLNPHRSIRFYIPERGGGEIAQRLADARPRFGKEHVGLIAVRARGEAGGRRLSIGALTRPLLCPLPSQTAEAIRSEEHTSELQSLMRISYAVFCLKQKKIHSNSYSRCNAP